MDRCLAVFPLMDGAFITLHALLLYVEAVMNEVNLSNAWNWW